jgi:hypothetical protein
MVTKEALAACADAASALAQNSYSFTNAATPTASGPTGGDGLRLGRSLAMEPPSRPAWCPRPTACPSTAASPA